MLDPKVSEQLALLTTPNDVLTPIVKGTATILKPRVGISTEVCQKNKRVKNVTIYSNAPLSATGFLPFLEWLGNHGYSYKYIAPGICYQSCIPST